MGGGGVRGSSGAGRAGVSTTLRVTGWGGDQVREQVELEGDLVDLVPLTAVYLVRRAGVGTHSGLLDLAGSLRRPASTSCGPSSRSGEVRGRVDVPRGRGALPHGRGQGLQDTLPAPGQPPPW